MNVLQEFQTIFDRKMIPYLDSLKIEDRFSEPVFYTLLHPSNKFRSATAILAADICGVEELALPIAAVSEIIHNSIIVQDDIADGDTVRRGNIVAWKKYGVCHALHAALYVLPECLRIMEYISGAEAKSSIMQGFWETYRHVCRAQIGQAQLKLTDRLIYADFLNIHHGKTAIGQWAVRSVAISAGKLEAARLLDSFAKCLGDAGSIKNDLEDFMIQGSYESSFSDIREGMVTYPLYSFFHQCSQADQQSFLRVFGGGDTLAGSRWAIKIAESPVIAHCKEKVYQLVEAAKAQLQFFVP